MRMLWIVLLGATACGPGNVMIGGTLKDGISGEVIEGGEVCFTAAEQVLCATSDADGYAEMEVAANSDIVDLRVEADGYYPTNTYGHTTDEDNVDVVLSILHTDAKNLIELSTGVEIDETKGVISFFANDVAGVAGVGAVGVSVSLAPSSGELLYLSQDRVPVADATATVDTGAAVFMNVNPGSATLSAPADCAAVFTYADFAGTQEIVIKANEITFLQVECEDM
ncbi:MAG: hypothetical protein ACI9MC_001489 [Kiritimatiellia bacterium]|jgi:hypothetical protein